MHGYAIIYDVLNPIWPSELHVQKSNLIPVWNHQQIWLENALFYVPFCCSDCRKSALLRPNMQKNQKWAVCLTSNISFAGKHQTGLYDPLHLEGKENLDVNLIFNGVFFCQTIPLRCMFAFRLGSERWHHWMLPSTCLLPSLVSALDMNVRSACSNSAAALRPIQGAECSTEAFSSFLQLLCFVCGLNWNLIWPTLQKCSFYKMLLFYFVAFCAKLLCFKCSSPV